LNLGGESISAFLVDPSSGVLSAVGGSPFSLTGGKPTSLTIDVYGRFLYVATSSTALYGFEINATSGALSVIPGSPFTLIAGPAAWIGVDPFHRNIYVASSVSATQGAIQAYRIDPRTGQPIPFLNPVPIPRTPQDGAVHPSGTYLYTTHGSASDVLHAMRVNPDIGEIENAGSTTITAPRFPQVNATGEFVYVASNNQIAGYRIKPVEGTLIPTEIPAVDASVQPGDFDMTRSGTHLYAPSVLNSQVKGFAIWANGNLLPVAGSPVAAPQNPNLLLVDPSERFLYVTSFGANSLSSYSVEPLTRGFSLINTVQAGSNASSMTIVGAQ
jgi:6-phosphogluconolactonase (cycloisomerase 2 family)